MSKQLHKIFDLLQRIDESYNNYALLNETLILEAASLADVYQKYYKQIPEEEFRQIVAADPTSGEDKMGKYSKWLLALYASNNLKLEDLYKATSYLTTFHKYKQKLDRKDIGQYKSLSDLFQAIEPYSDNTKAASHKEEIRKIKEGAEKVYEDNEWLVVIPHTRAAAIEYGKGTQWCTAATESYNYFEHYNEQGPLYININKKTGDKYQFHFESEQFMNVNDEDCGGVLTKEDPLYQFYEEKYGPEKTLPLLYSQVGSLGTDQNNKDFKIVGNGKDDSTFLVNIVNINTLEPISDMWFEDIAGCFNDSKKIIVKTSFNEYNLMDTNGNLSFDEDNSFMWLNYANIGSHFGNVLYGMTNKGSLLLDGNGKPIMDVFLARRPEYIHFNIGGMRPKCGFLYLLETTHRKFNVITDELKLLFDEWVDEIEYNDWNPVLIITKNNKKAIFSVILNKFSKWYDNMADESHKLYTGSYNNSFNIRKVRLNGKYNYITDSGIEIFDVWYDKIRYQWDIEAFFYANGDEMEEIQGKDVANNLYNKITESKTKLNENSIDRKVNKLISQKYNVTDFNEIRRIRSILLKKLPNARTRNEKWLPKIIEYMINREIDPNDYLEFNSFLGWLNKNDVDDNNINDPNFNNVPFSYIKNFYQNLMNNEAEKIKANADYRKVKTINGYTIRRLDSDEEAQEAGYNFYQGEWCVLDGEYGLIDECTLYIVTNNETYRRRTSSDVIPTYKTIIEKLVAMGKQDVAKRLFNDINGEINERFYPDYFDDDYFECATLGTGLPPYDEYGMSGFVVMVGEDGHEYGVYSRYNLPNMLDGSFLSEVEISELLQADFRQVFPYVERDDNITETRLRNIVRNVLTEAYPGLIDNDQNQDELHQLARQKGFNYIAYHNTDKDNLTFFDLSENSGIHFGSETAANQRGKIRGHKSLTKKFFLKIDNPYVVEKDFDWEMENAKYYTPGTPEEDDKFEEYLNQYDISTYLAQNGFSQDSYKTVQDLIEERGYDCIIYKNQKEDAGNYSVAMFNPNHIKLAEQTKDDYEQPIPLNKRFDITINDVRY